MKVKKGGRSFAAVGLTATLLPTSGSCFAGRLEESNARSNANPFAFVGSLGARSSAVLPAAGHRGAGGRRGSIRGRSECRNLNSRSSSSSSSCSYAPRDAVRLTMVANSAQFLPRRTPQPPSGAPAGREGGVARGAGGHSGQQQQQQQQHQHQHQHQQHHHHHGPIKEQGQGGSMRERVTSMYLNAQHDLRQGHIEKGIAQLRECLELSPRDSHSWLLLARTEQRRGRVKAAREVFGQATAQCPRNVHLLQAWAVMEHKNGKIKKARELFERGLQVDPGNAYVCHAFGLLEQKAKNFDMASRLFNQALAWRPQAQIVCALGEMEAERGRIEEAREVFRANLPRLDRGDHAYVYMAWARVEESVTGNSRINSSGSSSNSSSNSSNSSSSSGSSSSSSSSSSDVGKGGKQRRKRKSRGEARLAAAAAAARRGAPPPPGTTASSSSSSSGSIENSSGPAQTAAAAISGGADVTSLFSSGGSRSGGVSSTFPDLVRVEELLLKARECDPTNVKVHIAVAQLQLRRGDTDEALLTLEGARNLRHGDAQLFNMWGTILARTAVSEDNPALLDKAFKIVSDARRLFPAEQSLLQTLGLIENRRGYIDSAIQYYQKSIEIRPMAPAYVSWALLEDRIAQRDEMKLRRNSNGGHSLDVQQQAARQGLKLAPLTDKEVSDLKMSVDKHVAQARKLFELGISVDASHGPLYNAYASMEARRGNEERARGIYRRAIEARCDHMASVWQGLGALEAKQGHTVEAEALFSKGLERDSGDDTSFLLHSLGYLMLNGHRIMEARDIFSKGIHRYPMNAPLLLGLALVESRLGNLDEARELFKASTQADRTHAQAWQAWGVMEFRERNLDVARTLYEVGLKESPTHGALWQAYAMLEISLDQTDRARTLLKAGIQRCPGHVFLYQAWAVMETRMGNLDRARKIIKEGLQKDANHGPCWVIYAVIERESGKIDRARKIFELGLRADPLHGPLFCAYAKMEQSVGRIDKARELFERGLKADPHHAMLYHKLAEMEAMVGNFGALADLHARAQAVFSVNLNERSQEAKSKGDEHWGLHRRGDEFDV